MVALLRGVNVGGMNKLAMADLREAATACGYEQVRTYIQSGNLVFSTASETAEGVAERLQDAIAARTNVAPAVIVRTREELASIVERNPYVARGEPPQYLHVVFMSGAEKAAIQLADVGAYAPEEAVAIGRELYLCLPSGIGRSKLATALSRQKGRVATTRNWRTVTKLLELAGEIQ
jgi:uncharacterized protein (DUF1697 family)